MLELSVFEKYEVTGVESCRESKTRKESCCIMNISGVSHTGFVGGHSATRPQHFISILQVKYQEVLVKCYHK
jgi:hypothetical protein